MKKMVIIYVMRLVMYKHLLMSSKIKKKLEKQLIKEKEMREKVEKELKDQNKELKNLTNNQVTNNFGKIIKN